MNKEVTTLQEIKDLGSALTIEGLAEDSIKDFIEWIKKYTQMKNEDAYIIKGKTMNSLYGLTGSNAYPDDCNIVSIKLEDMENYNTIVLPRFSIGARWLDDIIDNNCERERLSC